MIGHTKDTWVVADLGDAIAIGGIEIGTICRVKNTVSGKPPTDEDRANARRIVACVNACTDIPTEQLESIGNIAPYGFSLRGIAQLKQQRDDVLEALRDLLENVSGIVPDKNCSCHMAPPCNDCVEWGALRESIALANYTFAKAGGAV